MNTLLAFGVLIYGIVLIHTLLHIEAILCHPKLKTDSTPSQVYWINNPTCVGEKWLMQFDETLFVYGHTVKLTLEYYRSHLDEFTLPPPLYRHNIEWKAWQRVPMLMSYSNQPSHRGGAG